MVTYPVLQSGFVALSQKGLKRPEPIEPTFREAVIFKDYKSPLNKYYYSPLATELFIEWCNNSKVLKSFDYRERVIKLACEQFGKYNFRNFLSLQNEKPSISDLHNVFIMETLEYLLVDKTRSISTVQWLSMLEATTVDNRVQVKVDSYFNRNALGTDNSVKIPTNAADIIQIWVQKENGFEDLMLCLFIMFGERTRRTELTNLTS
jgi:hypothetical protein